MAYKQKWGMSRKASPLNNESQGKTYEFGKDYPGRDKDIELYKSNFGPRDSDKEIDVDPSRNDIIQQNNNLANQNSMNVFTPGINIKKSIAKEVIKKKAPKSILSKALGFMGRRALMFGEIFLGSQSAYAPNASHHQMQQKFDQSAKLLAEEQRKKDIAGMGKKEIAEYDKKQREADLKWKYFDSKNAEHILQGKPYKPKHEFKQG